MNMATSNPGTRAVLKSFRMSASKVREVLDLIRGKDIISARDILVYSDRGSAKVILKLLASAVANAENNDEIPGDELFVSACFADEGQTLKRFKPRARGRASQILKRTCHITIVVSRMESSRISEISRKRNVDNQRRAERRSTRVKRSTLGSEDAVVESSVPIEAEIVDETPVVVAPVTPEVEASDVVATEPVQDAAPVDAEVVAVTDVVDENVDAEIESEKN